MILFFYGHLISCRNWKTQALFRHNIYICGIYRVSWSLIFKKVVIDRYWAPVGVSPHFFTYVPSKILNPQQWRDNCSTYFSCPSNQTFYPNRGARFGFWQFLINGLISYSSNVFIGYGLVSPDLSQIQSPSCKFHTKKIFFRRYSNPSQVLSRKNSYAYCL